MMGKQKISKTISKKVQNLQVIKKLAILQNSRKRFPTNKKQILILFKKIII